MKRNGTDVQDIDYTDMCKAIRSRMSHDINNYNEEQIIQSLEDNKCIKTIKRNQCLGRNNIISLKGKNGTHVHDRDMMIKNSPNSWENALVIITHKKVTQPDKLATNRVQCVLSGMVWYGRPLRYGKVPVW